MLVQSFPLNMTIELPAEIWDQIAGHLHGRELMPLMAVNRTFMRCAIREKYRELNLVSINRRERRHLESIR